MKGRSLHLEKRQKTFDYLYEGGKERVVDVDDAVRKTRDESRGEDAHVLMPGAGRRLCVHKSIIGGRR